MQQCHLRHSQSGCGGKTPADERRLNDSNRKSISSLTNYQPGQVESIESTCSLLVRISKFGTVTSPPARRRTPPRQPEIGIHRKKCLEQRSYKCATAGSYGRPNRPKSVKARETEEAAGVSDSFIFHDNRRAFYSLSPFSSVRCSPPDE